MVNQNWQERDLVPLAQRLRMLQLYRAVVVATTTGLAVWSGDGAEPAVLGLGVGALVVGQLAELVVRRSQTGGRRIFGVTLLLDGVVLAALLHHLGGLASPARYLVILHLVAVTLVGSHRTGVKLAIWHALLALLIKEATDIGWLHQAALDDPQLALATHIALMWSVTFVTAAASAVNEREILRRRYDLEALARMSSAIEQVSSLHSITQTLIDHLCETFDLSRAAVVSLRHDDLVTVAGRGLRPASGASAVTGSLAHVRTHRRTVCLTELGPDDPWLAAQLPDARHVLLVPLAPDGAVDDVLVVEQRQAMSGRVERRVLSTIERFAAHGGLAVRNARLHADLLARAQTDGLTGVANRATFDKELREELSRLDRQGGSLSLLLCDLDHFKAVNDTHGHQAGDDVLIELAQVLEDHTRSYDLVARYGGEEFAVIMPDTDEVAAAHLAERLRLAVTTEVSTVPVTLSGGVATVHDGGNSAALIATADEALYRAKRSGRNRICLGEDAVTPEPVDH
jgi:two-component system, cell cycle response regulator